MRQIKMKLEPKSIFVHSNIPNKYRLNSGTISVGSYTLFALVRELGLIPHELCDLCPRKSNKSVSERALDSNDHRPAAHGFCWKSEGRAAGGDRLGADLSRAGRLRDRWRRENMVFL
ncbi:hypothetical protein OROMI_029863 [Orobanche minor]